ncbi:Transmembrane domain-containing protein [Orpheovirus IHUMI-LCC2]|uniref:Transmembrane domain-containing protein n=1 Tax=Orpheovirus IHUMI-LCC2 TaxID=2023057 RepID=A0A2I2L3H1_9VIRU|nr:Transmembrane domain-containing protein [Orpheovirus IHUMI-LCC2]SNW62088.1 Transmembrane domain-containing protein [Orpheovirus IHUMI-LCC2]
MVAGVIVNIILVLILIAIIVAIIYYYNLLSRCNNEASQFCPTILCPPEYQSSPCGVRAYRIDNAGRTICSENTICTTDSNGRVTCPN